MADEGSTQRVTTLLDELHQVLESAEDLDDAAKKALRSAAGEIRSTLDHEGSSLDALRERVEQLEQSHPTLREILRRVMDQLAEMGI
jgi:chaperonin cofactor prefoldin